jgi:hypothetical protein
LEICINKEEKCFLTGSPADVLKIFLLGCDSSTRGFIMTINSPCAHIVPQFGSPPHFSLSSPTILLKMTSIGFSVPYLHMYRKYIRFDKSEKITSEVGLQSAESTGL